MAIKFKTQYDYDPGVDPGVSFLHDPGKTEQHHKDECDINVILKRFEKTGVLTSRIEQEPRYGDFSAVVDYQEALNIVNFAHEQFAMLEARVRARFENNPAKFLEFCENPANAREMIEMGLATERVVEEPAPKKKTGGVKTPTVPAAGEGPDA